MLLQHFQVFCHRLRVSTNQRAAERPRRTEALIVCQGLPDDGQALAASFLARESGRKPRLLRASPETPAATAKSSWPRRDRQPCATRAKKNSRLLTRGRFAVPLAMPRDRPPRQKAQRPKGCASGNKRHQRMHRGDRGAQLPPRFQLAAEERSAGVESETDLNFTGSRASRQCSARHDDAFRIAPSGTQNHNTAAFRRGGMYGHRSRLHLRGQRPSAAPGPGQVSRDDLGNSKAGVFQSRCQKGCQPAGSDDGDGQGIRLTGAA